MATRLSEDPKNRVLLLEAGRASHPYSRFPISFGLLIDNPAANWRYESEPESNTANRTIPVPRGKVLGGSSAINGLIYIRGQAEDFDHWRQLGNVGWSYDDVLPYFRKAEDNERGPDEFHGSGGPLGVSDLRDSHPLARAYVEAARQCAVDHQVLRIAEGPIGQQQQLLLRGEQVDLGQLRFRLNFRVDAFVARCNVQQHEVT